MAISEGVLAAIIGGAASLGSAGLSAGSAAMRNRQSFKWSRKYFDYQNQYNLEHYSPAANMARYKAAGINPHEAVGSAGGSGTSLQGSMNVPDYQSPIESASDHLTRGIQTALNFYAQKKNLQNQSDLVQSQVNKNNADAAKTNYQTEHLLPVELSYAKNREKIPLYQIGVMKLQQQRLLNEISLFSMQKQKYQLGIDLMQLEKEYHKMADKWRAQSIEYDAKNKKNQYGISSLDLKNYQQFGLRPQDPYYTRIGANIIDSLEGGDTFLGKYLRKWFHLK